MMTADDVRMTVKKSVVSVMGTPIDATTIPDAASYKEDLGLDSLAILEIAVEVERVFEIEVPEEELAEIRTIEDTVAVVQKYRAMKEKGAAVQSCNDGLLSPV